MRIVFTPLAMEQWKYWQKNNPTIATRIILLLRDISQHPYIGIGKPEPLRYELSGKWSRRINAEHRIVYSVSDDTVTVYIFSLRYHYLK